MCLVLYTIVSKLPLRIFKDMNGFNYDIYSIATDHTPIDISGNEYIGYRLSFHTFYQPQPSRVRDMLQYWSLKMTYKNCELFHMLFNKCII